MYVGPSMEEEEEIARDSKWLEKLQRRMELVDMITKCGSM